MVEEREELLVSLFDDSKPVLRTSHFLRPIVKSIEESVPKPRSSSSLPSKFDPKSWALEVLYNGWTYPSNSWRSWVDNLKTKYQSVWEKAGVYEAIMSSKCRIARDEDVIIGLAEKWCGKTNTFVFSWGEATVTLEDMMVLGGFSVCGNNISSSRPDVTVLSETKEVEAKLIDCFGNGFQSVWMKKFRNSGSEIEHEAFLSFWLTRFVFAESREIMNKLVFPIAVKLARGEEVVLAPPVLATIYRDLSILKEAIVGLKKFDQNNKNNNHDGDDSYDDNSFLEVNLWSPLQLVQLWAWERFQVLQPKTKPKPNSGEPRAARWEKTKVSKVNNVRMVLESAGPSFRWRPYTKTIDDNRIFNGFYKEKSDWINVNSTDTNMLSFVRCVRVSELVGLKYIEQYHPHRVAMQFGLDQDIPVHVERRLDQTSETAWRNYIRPLGNQRFYIPSRLSEPGVTIRYSKWWKQSLVVQLDMIKSSVPRRQRSSRKTTSQASSRSLNVNVVHGFCPKLVEQERGGDIKMLRHVKQEIVQTGDYPGFPQKRKIVEEEKGVESRNYPRAPPLGFPMKFKMVEKEKCVDIREETNEHENERKDGNLFGDTVERSTNKVDITSFGLENRVSRLERIFNNLISAKLHKQVQTH